MRFMSCFFHSRTEPRPLSDAHGESRPSFGRTCRPQRESGETPPRRSYRWSARPRSCQRLSLAFRRPGPWFGHVSWLWLRASDKWTHRQSLRPVSQLRQAQRLSSSTARHRGSHGCAGYRKPGVESVYDISPSPPPRRYFLYSNALKSRSFSRRALTSATCWRWFSPVVSSGG